MTKEANNTVSKSTIGAVTIGNPAISIDKLYMPEDFYIQGVDLDLVNEMKRSYEMNMYVPEIEVSRATIDGEELFLVVSGRSRAIALKDLFDNDLISSEIKVIEISGSPSDLLVHAIKSARSKKASSLVLAKAYKRLSELGLSQVDIAKQLDVTGAEVSNYLLLADTPDELQDMVLNGVISSTFVYEKVRRYGYHAALLMAKEEHRAKKEKDIAKAKKIKGEISLVNPLTKKLKIQPKKVKKAAELMALLDKQLSQVSDGGESEVEIEIDANTALELMALSKEMQEIESHNERADEFLSFILGKSDVQEAA
ncbi:hypothetical protein LMH73_025040 [Vibrio splendidus]|nr:hypothetical protein [Vibrio splendidus]MCC4882493.1 hypothetical protein [Vibrio splendidus]